MAAAFVVLAAAGVVGCGDRCESLCRETAARLAECRGDSLTWADLGARGRADFVATCRGSWDRTSAKLSSPELTEALDICRDVDVSALSCDEILALYAARE